MAKQGFISRVILRQEIQKQESISSNLPPSPVYEPATSIIYDPVMSPYLLLSPVYEPASPVYEPLSPVYEPASPVYVPATSLIDELVASPVYEPSASPVYEPASPVYEPASPDYEPASPVYEPASPDYEPASPVYEPATTPIYELLVSPVYEPASSPVYEPAASPIYEPATSPIYEPTSSSVYEPATSPIYDPSSVVYPRYTTGWCPYCKLPLSECEEEFEKWNYVVGANKRRHERTPEVQVMKRAKSTKICGTRTG